MSLVVNHNMMAMNAARNLGVIYGRLAKSTQRLSSGLRVNSAADDAAGLAIRELMRSDIAVIQQGIRNASDGISMIQTAEGAMSVIDEKLIRMKELAEQASTGTYTTVQREIMNSEYQAMAKEIDRIANATDFAGTKLLDGSISNIHNGQGLKIHFGTGNSAAEDYYFINIGDVRATSNQGLRIGGDAKNDIWGTAGTGAGAGAGGCCGGGVTNLTASLGSTNVSGRVFAYGYNWDMLGNTTSNQEGNLSTAKYIGGMYKLSSGASLQDMINAVNAGSQSRIKLEMTASSGGQFFGNSATVINASAERVCLGKEVYYWGSASLAAVTGKTSTGVSRATTISSALTSAINIHSTTFWALQSGNNVYVFAKAGGDNNSLLGCDEQVGTVQGSATVQGRVQWRNVETNVQTNAGAQFSLGGNKWATMRAVPTAAGSYGVTLEGKDVGDRRDLWIMDVGSGASYDLNTGGTTAYGVHGLTPLSTMTGFTHSDFSEIQNAADGSWVGADIRTQSHAQEALDAIQAAIERKDVIRANLGAYQNRLENTITNQSIMAENLQASESRISDVDIAVEMTEFTRNNILSQAATAMLSQANSLPQLALSLLK